MIAKLARWHFAGRPGQPVAAATAVPCNDNHAPRRSGGDPKRMSRRVPVCHWRVQPLTGALECVWQTEEAGGLAGAAAEEPQLPSLIVPGTSGRQRRQRSETRKRSVVQIEIKRPMQRRNGSSPLIDNPTLVPLMCRRSHEVWKPVQFRRGRATVKPDLLRDPRHSNGTRNPRRSI